MTVRKRRIAGSQRVARLCVLPLAVVAFALFAAPPGVGFGVTPAYAQDCDDDGDVGKSAHPGEYEECFPPRPCVASVAQSVGTEACSPPPGMMRQGVKDEIEAGVVVAGLSMLATCGANIFVAAAAVEFPPLAGLVVPLFKACAGAALATYAGATALYLDPPDPRWAEVALPAPLPASMAKILKGLESCAPRIHPRCRLLSASVQWLEANWRVAAISEAMGKATNRFNTAKSLAQSPSPPVSGEGVLTPTLAQGAQAAAGKVYARLLATALGTQTAAGKRFADRLRGTRYDFTLPADKRRDVQRRVLAGQLIPRSAHERARRSFGLSEAQLRQLLRTVFDAISAKYGNDRLRLSDIVATSFKTTTMRGHYATLTMVEVAMLTTSLTSHALPRSAGIDLNSDLQRAEMACSASDRDAEVSRFIARANSLSRSGAGAFVRTAARALLPYKPPANNQPPTASFRYQEQSFPPHTLSLTSLTSSDPDGRIQRKCYRWDYGDGTTSAGVANNHTFPGSGDFTVTLTVTDNAFATAQTQQVVHVP